jgi:hypothetical protein
MCTYIYVLKQKCLFRGDLYLFAMGRKKRKYHKNYRLYREKPKPTARNLKGMAGGGVAQVCLYQV